ncbi:MULTISPECIES: hypothetical protein [unclassified Nitratiruptor]|uniref:hypothetical protein n=1 Tax=unclassified Nitratiruptor TaxID=2624044 RepID=UPI00191626F7|nr:MULTISPECIES: hypothetical protein [unclassified Nitratiruptor]BCD61017.1 hypothetical protein NitYY0810_C1798 [Nitratiruptor sp. YY08-10]BCD64949.1 hypothetical protein NitYY0814_C1806 [Nitratiruptor sp. YY08-14]
MIRFMVFFVPIFVFGYGAKGLNAYKKLCVHCHGPAFKGAAMLYSDEWTQMFAENAKRLRKVHKDNPKAMKYIDSNYFIRRAKYLKRFLKNNARDMGVVRSCDGLNCG